MLEGLPEVVPRTSMLAGHVGNGSQVIPGSGIVGRNLDRLLKMLYGARGVLFLQPLQRLYVVLQGGWFH